MTDKHILTDYLLRRRANPYYLLVSVLFAAILEEMAIWISQIVTQIVRAHQLREVSVPVVQIFLTVLVFFYVIYLWLYFSRILIYLVEGPRGETWTFILGFALMSGVACLPLLWLYWPFVLSICTLFVSLKNLQVKKDVAAIPGHPFQNYALDWVVWSLVYSGALFGLGFLELLIPHPSRISFHAIGLLVLGIWSIVLIFRNFHIMEVKVKQELSTFANAPQHSHWFVNPE